MSELSPVKSPGGLGSVEDNLIAGSVVVAYFFNIGVSYLRPYKLVQWRLPIASQAAFFVLVAEVSC